MLDIARGWSMEVERGPGGWLLVRLHCEPDQVWETPPLAETLWSLLSQNFSKRLLLECEEMTILPSELLGQLVLLQKRIITHGGQMKLTGLNPSILEALRISRLDRCLHLCDGRAEALMGANPTKPR